MAVPDIRISMARCSRASLNLLAANDGLIVGENYLITSETPNVHCVATSVSTYNEYYNKADADAKFSLPTQTGNSGKYLTTDGSVASWGAVSAGGLQYFIESTNTYNSKYYNKLAPVLAQADVNFVIQPKGSGAIVAQLPNGTTSGGNTRGAYAVDLQMVRNLNSNVASGECSVICGGYANTASGGYSIVGGGGGNLASGARAVIAGGDGNIASGVLSTVVGGSGGNAFLEGSLAYANGTFSVAGDAQKLQLVARGVSKSVSTFDLAISNNVGNSRLVLPNYSNWAFILRLSAIKANGYALNSFGAIRYGMIARRDTAASVQIALSSLENQDFVIGTFATPTIAITADTLNGALKISITPTDVIKTRWVATVDITQCGNGVVLE